MKQGGEVAGEVEAGDCRWRLEIETGEDDGEDDGEVS